MGGERVRVWLDDTLATRPPAGSRTFVPEQVIGLLRGGKVAELSLDHDLGLEPGRTGHAVLVWLEREVAAGRWPGPLPAISVHSANPVGRRRMLRLLRAIELLHSTGGPRLTSASEGPPGALPVSTSPLDATSEADEPVEAGARLTARRAGERLTA